MGICGRKEGGKRKEGKKMCDLRAML